MSNEFYVDELEDEIKNTLLKYINETRFLENIRLEKELMDKNLIKGLKIANNKLKIYDIEGEKYYYEELARDYCFIEDLEEYPFFYQFAEKFIEETETPCINKFTFYIASFFYDINKLFDVFYLKYYNLIYNILPKYYYPNDKNLKEKIDIPLENRNNFDLNDFENTIEDFSEITGGFLTDTDELFKKFMKNIYKYLDVYFKLIFITKRFLRKIDNDDLADYINQIFYFLQNEVDITYEKLSDIRKLNESLKSVDDAIINEQYNEIRKFINKCRKRFGDVRLGGSVVYSYNL